MQRLAIGTQLVQLLKPLFPRKKVDLLRTSTEGRLTNDFASIKEKHNRFNTILLVGHSNPQGLQLADGVFRQWAVVANWLAPFKPKTILLVACSGARFEGARALFEGLNSLRDLYGSPIELTSQQTIPLTVATLASLAGKPLSKDVNASIQAVNFMLTRGVSYHWSRDEVLNEQNIEAMFWNPVADILKTVSV
jgi:hypothetical protein